MIFTDEGKRLVFSLTEREAEKILSGVRRAYSNINYCNQPLFEMCLHISNAMRGRDFVTFQLTTEEQKMTTFKTIAQKLLTSKDYKHGDQVNQDIEKLVELYEDLQKELKTWEEMADSHGKAMEILQKENDYLRNDLIE